MVYVTDFFSKCVSTLCCNFGCAVCRPHRVADLESASLAAWVTHADHPVPATFVIVSLPCKQKALSKENIIPKDITEQLKIRATNFFSSIQSVAHSQFSQEQLDLVRLFLQ